MNKSEKYLGIGIIATLILVIVVVVKLPQNSISVGANANHGTIKCTTSTVASSTIGHQASTQLLAANSNRAWARLQIEQGNANIYTLAFNNGTAATVNTGLQLSSSTIQYIDFGKNTDFPYVGAVTGITNVSSTTIRITSCSY